LYMTNAGYLAIATSVSIPAISTIATLALTQPNPSTFWRVAGGGGVGTILGISIAIALLRHHRQIASENQ
ncbi:MAG TPA: hypothetical protein V6D16_08805, partial [Candidatus Obscuribacterales bacterium]